MKHFAQNPRRGPLFNLKAVNPIAIVKIDTCTPDEVIQSIEDQGRIVANALATLRSLLQTGSTQ